MKKILIIIATFLFGTVICSAQEKYVYDKFGQLKYIVSDSLLVSIPELKENYLDSSDVIGFFEETWKTSYYTMGGHTIGYRTTKLFGTRKDKSSEIKTTYVPVLFDEDTDLNSITNLVAFLNYVKNNYEKAEPYVQYIYSDNAHNVVLTVLTFGNAWEIWRKDGELERYKISCIDNFIDALEKIKMKFNSRDFE